MKTTMLVIILNMVVALGFAQDNHPVSWKISSEKIAPLTYSVQLTATIKDPYHIYPLPSSGGGLGMPTEILFEEDTDVEFLGTIEAKGVEPSNGESVPYYKNSVTFSQIVKLKSEKKTTLAFTIKYMACNDQMCLPPSTKQFTFVIDEEGERDI